MTILAWILLGVAASHIVFYHTKLGQWSSKGRPLGVNKCDRHARIRTGEESYRGPLKIPFMGRALKAIQRKTGEGDPNLREGATRKRGERGKAVELGKALHVDEELGTFDNIPHGISEKGRFVGFTPECEACQDHTCNIKRLRVYRGFPVHRGSIYARRMYAMDLRRLLCIVAAFLLFLIHFTLCFNELALSARWKFQTEYVAKRKAWGEREGIDINKQSPILPDECSYFDYSSIPIAYYGKSNLNAGVLLT